MFLMKLKNVTARYHTNGGVLVTVRSGTRRILDVQSISDACGFHASRSITRFYDWPPVRAGLGLLEKFVGATLSPVVFSAN